MPVILAPDDYAAWLDPEIGDATRLRAMLAPRGELRPVARAVDRRVNDVRNEDQECLASAPAWPQQGSLL